MYHFMKNGVCVASKKSVGIFIFVANGKKRGTILPADEQSIADSGFSGIGGKSGLRGTAYRLMTGRSNPTIRATVTNRLKIG